MILTFRYIELTEEEKEKLKGSHKVAKKLEKLENLGQDRYNKAKFCVKIFFTLFITF